MIYPSNLASAITATEYKDPQKTIKRIDSKTMTNTIAKSRAEQSRAEQSRARTLLFLEG